jgi:hypothetical protein
VDADDACYLDGREALRAQGVRDRIQRPPRPDVLSGRRAAGAQKAVYDAAYELYRDVYAASKPVFERHVTA